MRVETGEDARMDVTDKQARDLELAAALLNAKYGKPAQSVYAPKRTTPP